MIACRALLRRFALILSFILPCMGSPAAAEVLTSDYEDATDYTLEVGVLHPKNADLTSITGHSYLHIFTANPLRHDDIYVSRFTAGSALQSADERFYRFPQRRLARTTISLTGPQYRSLQEFIHASNKQPYHLTKANCADATLAVLQEMAKRQWVKPARAGVAFHQLPVTTPRAVFRQFRRFFQVPSLRLPPINPHHQPR